MQTQDIPGFNQLLRELADDSRRVLLESPSRGVNEPLLDRGVLTTLAVVPGGLISEADLSRPTEDDGLVLSLNLEVEVIG